MTWCYLDIRYPRTIANFCGYINNKLKKLRTVIFMSKLLKLFNLKSYTINQEKMKKYRKLIFEKLLPGGLIVYFYTIYKSQQDY